VSGSLTNVSKDNHDGVVYSKACVLFCTKSSTLKSIYFIFTKKVHCFRA